MEQDVPFFGLPALRTRHRWSSQYAGRVSHMNLEMAYSSMVSLLLCGIEHRSAVSEGRRFSCSWGLRLVFVSSSWPEERTIHFVLFRTRNSSSVLFCFIVFLSVSWAYRSPVLISFFFFYRDCQTIAGLPGPIHEGLSILKKVKIFPVQFNLSFF